MSFLLDLSVMVLTMRWNVVGINNFFRLGISWNRFFGRVSNMSGFGLGDRFLLGVVLLG